MRSRTALFLSLTLLVAGATIAWATLSIVTQATIGSDNRLTGGAYPKDLTDGSVQPYGDHSITGECQNQTGHPMTDVTVELIATTGNAPGVGSGSKMGSASPAESTSKGKKFNFNPPVPSGGSISVDISTEAPASQPASTFKIYITPSCSNPPGVEADYLGLLAYTPSRARQEVDLESHGNASVIVDVKNSDPGNGPQRIVGFSGVYSFPSGEQNKITHVDLLESIAGQPVAGAITAITSATDFSITGFSLTGGTTYALLIRTAIRSSGTTTLNLRATFVP